MRQKKLVRGWGISEKGTGTWEGAVEKREGERGRHECLGGVAVKWKEERG